MQINLTQFQHGIADVLKYFNYSMSIVDQFNTIPTWNGTLIQQA